jgi:MoaA/NifB/PqqE/SkfB family radical SAM enzyme
MAMKRVAEENLGAERLKDSGDFPAVVLIDSTNYCNLACSMCGHRVMTREKGVMDMMLLRKIIDEIAEVDRDIRVWMVFFGEALILRYKLYWMIHYAKSKGLTDVVLNSNANLLDRDACLSLIECGLDAIYVGIDAFSPETYARVRVKGDYGKVVDNVNNLLQTEKELGVSNPRVFVQFVEMDENAHEVRPFTEYWTGQGATVKIRPKISWANTVEAGNLTAGDRYPCYWAMRTMNICWDGRVVLCAVDFDAQYVAGDLNRQSMRQVWNDQLKLIRDLHSRGEYDKLPPFCSRCGDWQAASAQFFKGEDERKEPGL